jgi:uncharacterized membrane protein YfcA
MDSAPMGLLSFAAGMAVATLTAPVGISGAVFLLPVQLSVLNVPKPAVTPTNLLFNIVSIPGALARYRRRAPLRSPLTTLLLAGTLPGVIAGAVIRVFAIPGPVLFRLFVASLLCPLGVWLCLRSVRSTHEPALAARTYYRPYQQLRVGVAGFEPTASSSRTKRATKLRHTPLEATTAYRTRPSTGETAAPKVSSNCRSVRTRPAPRPDRTGRALGR